MITSTSGQHAEPGSASRRIGPVNQCPRHGGDLDGGPVQFHCPAGHRVMAADIDHEFNGAVA